MSGVLETSEGPTPGFLLWRLSLKWRVAVDRAVAPLGLTHAQYSLLSSLLAMGPGERPPSQRELADHTGLEALYVSKLCRTLESEGFIERVRDPADTRAVRLSLTARGTEITRRAVAIVQRLIDELMAPLGGLGSQDSAALVGYLEVLLDTPLGIPSEPPQR